MVFTHAPVQLLGVLLLQVIPQVDPVQLAVPVAPFVGLGQAVVQEVPQ
jgi:hypothetical protein